MQMTNTVSIKHILRGGLNFVSFDSDQSKICVLTMNTQGSCYCAGYLFRFIKGALLPNLQELFWGKRYVFILVE